MSELSDVYVEYTFTIKALGQVHRAVVEVPGAKIAEFRQRENDQESNSFDIAHSLSEQFVRHAMLSVLTPNATYALGHAYLTTEPDSIRDLQPISEGDDLTVWVL
jgi:hypothetical protein